MFKNAATRADTLSYVPVVIPNTATVNIKKFFNRQNGDGPFELLQAQANSITGGNTNANVVEHNAPIRDMNKFNFGTSSEMETKITKITN